MTDLDRNPMTVATNAIAMARAMRNLGRTTRAIAKYDEALAALPDATEAFDELLAMLEAEGDWRGIADRCGDWLAMYPDHATNKEADRIHTRRIDALCVLGGLELAFATYGLEPVARADAAIGPDEILCVVGVRNEGRRLPAFLDHHRRLGVDRFLIVDNESDDESLAFLAAQPDTVVWRTAGSYRGANCGAAWWDLLLRRHAQGNWCLILDADEHLVFPDHESSGLPGLCAELDAEGTTCYCTVSLDMYPEGPLSAARCEPGQDPLEVFPYFDHAWYRRRRPFAGPRHNLVNHWGGVRARVLGGHDLGGYLLDKIPLFRHRTGETLMSGNHWRDRPSEEISDGRGVLLHFKYDSHFTELVEVEASRGEHAGGARTYLQMAAELAAAPDPTFFDPRHSVRLEDVAQLLRFGIMRSVADSGAPPSEPDRIPIPAIGEVRVTDHRPRWSVVIPAPSTGTDETIEAVRRALADQPSSEIVVVFTAGSRADPASLTTDDRYADDRHRVVAVITSQNLTETDTIDLGIEQACGEWVHVLSPGWRCTPDAYASVAPLLERGDAGHPPAVITTASDPLDLDLGLAPAQVILRRDRLSECGGFASTIAAASTWELTQRAASVGGAAVSPVEFATAIMDPEHRSAIGFGEDIAHRLDAIALAAMHRSLDDAQIEVLLDRCASDAHRLITDDLERSRPSSALATLTEILGASIAPASRDALLHSIQRRLR